MLKFPSLEVKLSERRRFILIALLFAAALMLRAVSAGAEYLPILDDSVQYISYPTSHDYGALIESEGLFASRPLAALMDLYVVGQMNFCLLLPVLLLSCMHAIAGVLFLRLFSKIWGTGESFAILYALLPLGVEGTYWLSAASRLVPGLLFCAAAATLLEAFIDHGKWWRAAAFALAALLSYGFYEQVLVVSFTLTALQFLRRARERRAWAAGLAIPMVAVYFIFTGLHSSSGALGSRMSIILPTSAWYFKNHLPEVVRQVGAAFIKGGVKTLFVGFARGFMLCIGGVRGILCLLAFIGAGALIYFLSRAAKNMSGGCDGEKRVGLGVWIWGFLLFLAPITPYFIIDNPWFSLRATVPSYIGAGLMLDALLRLLFKRGRVYSAICAVAASICLIAGVSEVNDYHAVGEYDNAIAEELLSKADEMQGRVGILCLEEFPIKGQNYSYHEHIASVATADWSLYGKLVAVNGGELDFMPVPLGVEGFSFYKSWNQSIKRISGFDQLWLWDDDTMTLTKMQAYRLPSGEQDYELALEDGTPWGRVWEEGEYGYVEIYE